MQLATEKSKRTSNPLKEAWFIYGAWKLGKTTLASKMSDPYFIATERGHAYVEVYKTDVSSWGELKSVMNLLLTSKHQHKTIVVDTADEAFNMCCHYIYKREGFSHMSELDGGRGYEYVRDEFGSVISKLTQSNFGVVFLAHEKLVKSTFQGVEKWRYWPNLMKTGRDVLLPKVDHIGRIFTKAVTVDGKRLHQRHVSFCNTADWEAGSRGLSEHGDILIEPEDACWSNVHRLFAPASPSADTEKGEKKT